MDDSMVQQRDIGKLWGAFERLNGDVRELRVALVGIDNTNGLRGELRGFIEKFDADHAVRLKDVEDRVEEGIALGKHLYHIERHKPGECIGKAALDSYVSDLNAKEKRSTDLSIELKKSRLAMIGAITVAGMYVGGDIILGLLSKGTTP